MARRKMERAMSLLTTPRVPAFADRKVDSRKASIWPCRSNPCRAYPTRKGICHWDLALNTSNS